MKSKYGFSHKGEMLRNGSRGSNVFKGICKNWDITCKGAIWALGNGSKVSFWLDTWTGMLKPLIELVTESVDEEERNLKVKDYVANGGWNWTTFAYKLPSSALPHKALIKPPDPLADDDAMFWAYSKNGEFTIESAYRILSMKNVASNPGWRVVWG